MLEASGLCKNYGTVAAVDDVTFRLRPGCVTGLLGPNGSGKTTILRLALGLVKPTAGAVTIDGRLIAALTYPFQHVGALLDASWVHPNRSAAAHLTWICQASRIPLQQVDWALEEVGLTSVANRKVGTFSFGMRQRLGLASTILGEPKLLILDEPLNGLDPEGTEWVRGFIRRRAEAGCAVLLASHDMREMEASADRVLVMANGRLLFHGALDELRGGSGGQSYVDVACSDAFAARRAMQAGADGLDNGGPGDPITVVSDTVVRVPGADVGEVAARLRAAGVEVRRIEQGAVSLHEMYMEMTRGQDRRGDG